MLTIKIMLSINIFFYFIIVEDMIYKRFQNMESTFRANERKIRQSKTSGKGTDDIYKPKWEYYDMLLFLKRTCAQSDSIDNLSSQNNISLSNQEMMNCSPVPNSYCDVQNTSSITNVYYDENMEVSVKLSLYIIPFMFSIILISFISQLICIQIHCFL